MIESQKTERSKQVKVEGAELSVDLALNLCEDLSNHLVQRLSALKPKRAEAN